MANNTQKIILKTFGDMLERMPLEKITVTALIKECNISRNTFYYHYEDIYALLNESIFSFLGTYEEAADSGSWKETLKSMLYTCRDNKKKFYHIYNSLSRDRLEQFVFGRADNSISAYIHRVADPRNIDPERVDVIIDIVTYTVYGYMMRFIWNDMRDDIEANVDKIGTILDELLEKLLH